MPTALSSIRNLLLPGQSAITGMYEQLPAVRKQIFKERKSNMALEQVHQASLHRAGLHRAGRRPSQADNASGHATPTAHETHNELAVLFAITRKAIDDNLYKAEFGPASTWV